jgi:N-acetylmuramoyl-L-alanine amidase
MSIAVRCLMKKLITAVLPLFIVLFLTTNSFAQSMATQQKSVVAMASLQDVEYFLSEDGHESVAITVDVCNDYNVFRLKSPDRIVIDISNTYFSGKQQVINTGSASLKAVRYARFDDKTARVVLDVSGSPDYSIEKVGNQIVVHIDGTAVDTDGSKSGIGDRSETRDEDSDLESRGTHDRDKLSVVRDFDIEYAVNNGADTVVISTNKSKEYNIMRLTGPDRIVIDIPETAAPRAQQQIDINSSLIKAIRYARFQKDTARIVLDVNEQAQFKVNEKSGLITLDILNPGYKNIVYHNNGDRVYLSLAGVQLTQGGEQIKKFYTEEYSSDGKVYTITFPSTLADIGEGEMVINDGLLESISISKDASGINTSIVFKAKSKLAYRTIARPETKDTNITIIRPALKEHKLVVIDAGHGGREPGAVYGDLLEKDLNLDIAKRLNNLLRSNKVETYMLREDDSFIGLYERAYIANDLNAALFISIHNNSLGDPNYGGTMTLYYPQKSNTQALSGKTFAEIVQNRLVNSLYTTNRKIVERPNLVVLKATKMPAALAEIAFMTNTADRRNLQDANFRQKAAAALCDAVVEALKKVK